MSGRVSILLCTRNRPEKARRCIASILDNTYSDFELIVVDQSTDDQTRDAVSSIDDSRLVYIRTTTVGLSRSSLEMYFRRELKRSVHDEILRHKLHRCFELLNETQMGIAEVARACGFRSVQYLNTVFKRELGATPAAWREGQRGGEPEAEAGRSSVSVS